MTCCFSRGAEFISIEIMNRHVLKIALLLFGSGSCALVYQMTWLREFRLIFGASTASTAAVVAIFMGGLGLGSIFLGGRADRKKNPLRFYANLETGIAASVALTPGLILLARQIYIWMGGTDAVGMVFGTGVRLFLSVLVLGLPTVLMGGTLPAAARAAETNQDRSRRHLALLYGLNTLGAVTGAFASTFFLLEILGNRNTLFCACLVNLLVAVFARKLARGQEGEEEPESQPAAPPVEAPADSPMTTGTARISPGFVLPAAALVGFAFFLMEIVWYRMLGPILGGSSFTFGLILAVALLGVGLGGAAYAIFMRNRPATLRAFALTCGLEALFMAIPFALGDRVAVLAILLRPLGSIGFSGYVLGWAAVTSLVVLPAACLAGFQFPLLIALLGQGRERVGSHVGLAYGLNTAGAIAGSLAGGFGLLPLLSAPGTWQFAVAMLVLLGFAALAFPLSREWRSSGAILPAGAALAALLLLFSAGPTAAWRHSPIGAGRAKLSLASSNKLQDWIHMIRRSTPWEAEGVESSIALSISDGYAFIINGKVDGNAVGDAGTQVMGGMVGAILHPHPRRALVIGLGTGSTAGWLGAIPSMERVDVMELEPAIEHVARVCAPVNQNVLENPKVHLHFGDAREALLVTSRRYDIIFSEPSNPYRAGVASLYTKEFYDAVVERLNDGGLFLQWLQAYEVDSRTIRTAVATLASAFPAVETWRTTYRDLLLVCSLQPVKYDASILRARIREEPIRSALEKAWRVIDLEGMFAHFVARADLSRAIAQQVGKAINRDNRNIVEFGFARTVGNDSYFDPQELVDLARLRGEDRPEVNGEFDWNRVEERRMSMALLFRYAPGVPAFFDAGERARTAAKVEYHMGLFSNVVQRWLEQEQEPSDPVELVMLAESLADLGDEKALPIIERLRPFEPIEADVALTRLRFRQGKLPEAVEALERAFQSYRVDPWPIGKVMYRAADLAVDLAAQDPGNTLGLRLYRGLQEPFVLYLMDEKRLSSLLAIAETLDGNRYTKLTRNAVRALEPHPPWQKKFLLLRFQCYAALNDPLAGAAERDLRAFLESSAFPIAFGLEPDSRQQ